MAAPAGKVPILQSVRAGAAFVGARWRVLTPITFAGVAAVLVAAGLTGALSAAPALPLLMFLLQALVMGAVYAGYLGVALKGDEERRGAFFGDVARLIPAMAVTGLFLFLLMFIAFLPGGVVLTAASAPWAAELQAHAGDPAATSLILQRAMQANPAPFLALAAIYAFIWLALTSRLYLVAPATVAENHVRTFETWAWTKGAMLRIAAARLLLLAPLSAGLFVAQGLLAHWARAQGGETAQGWAAGLAVVFVFASLVVLALEAGLSAYLYRGLRPKPA
ncbi:MAG: hypothetical protein AB7L65_00745 [Hyphomonadaceae bacterium]